MRLGLSSQGKFRAISEGFKSFHGVSGYFRWVLGDIRGVHRLTRELLISFGEVFEMHLAGLFRRFRWVPGGLGCLKGFQVSFKEVSGGFRGIPGGFKGPRRLHVCFSEVSQKFHSVPEGFPEL